MASVWLLWYPLSPTIGEVRYCRQYRIELLGLGEQSLDHRRRVAVAGVLHGDANHSAGLQIHRLLGLVRQMGPAVLQLRDLRD